MANLAVVEIMEGDRDEGLRLIRRSVQAAETYLSDAFGTAFEGTDLDHRKEIARSELTAAATALGPLADAYPDLADELKEAWAIFRRAANHDPFK